MDKLTDNEKRLVRALIKDMTSEFKKAHGDKKHTNPLSKIKPRDIVRVMETVELFKGLSGANKKNLVLYVVEETVETATGIDVEMDFIKDTIDIIVDVSRGNIKLNKVVGCFSKCIPKFTKKLK